MSGARSILSIDVLLTSTRIFGGVRKNCTFWANATQLSIWVPRTRRKRNDKLTLRRVGFRISFHISFARCGNHTRSGESCVIRCVLSEHDRLRWCSVGVAREGIYWAPTPSAHHHRTKKIDLPHNFHFFQILRLFFLMFSFGLE